MSRHPQSAANRIWMADARSGYKPSAPPPPAPPPAEVKRPAKHTNEGFHLPPSQQDVDRAMAKWVYTTAQLTDDERQALRRRKGNR